MQYVSCSHHHITKTISDALMLVSSILEMVSSTYSGKQLSLGVKLPQSSKLGELQQPSLRTISLQSGSYNQEVFTETHSHSRKLNV